MTSTKKRTFRIEKMHLVDLPSDISPGGVALRPLDESSSRLVCCSVCRGYSANAYLASCGHSYCSQCATLRPTEALSDEAGGLRTRICQIYCHPCKERKDAERLQVSLVLDSMRFACACGFEGKLREIKFHFWRNQDEGGGHREVNDPDREVNDLDREVDDDNNNNQQPTGGNVLVATADQFREQNEKILAELHDLRQRVAVRSGERAGGGGGKQYISVHIKDLIEQHRERRDEVWSPLYRWWGDGYPCATQIHIDVIKHSSWLGVYHQTFLEASTQPWPMKKRIRFELLNSRGGVVKTYEAPLYVNGKSISKCFAAPLKDAGYGLSKVIKIEKLQHFGDIVSEDGILSLTVEAIPL